MSTVKARWHVDLDALGSGVPDLWAETVEETGLPIDLVGSFAKLNEELMALVKREERLYGQGVTCAIKDREDTTCWACPLFRGGMEDPLGYLCTVGREQERVSTRMAVARMEEETSAEAQDQDAAQP